jgi:hypothetical protein
VDTSEENDDDDDDDDEDAEDDAEKGEVELRWFRFLREDLGWEDNKR